MCFNVRGGVGPFRVVPDGEVLCLVKLEAAAENVNLYYVVHEIFTFDLS